MFQKYICVAKIKGNTLPFQVQDHFFSTFRGSRGPTVTFSGLQLFAYSFTTRNVNTKITRKFEKEITAMGAGVLYSSFLTPDTPAYARFFSINFGKLFEAEKADLITKIQQTIKRKIFIHDDVYYIILPPSKACKNYLTSRIDELLAHPAIYCPIKIDTLKKSEVE